MTARATALATAVLAALAAALPARAAAQPLEWTTLESGLRLSARRIEGSESAAVLVLLRIGDAQDPEGRAGLAHLIEHLLVTAPAEGFPRRSLEEVADRYRAGFHARTGEDSTAIGVVVPRARLDEELRSLAARLAALRPEEEDLLRARAQVEDEIGAMWDRTPRLVAANRARELVIPRGFGRRRGGTVEGVRAIDLALVRDRLARYYGGANAIVAIAGGIDPEETAARARAIFAHVPRAEPPPPADLDGVRAPPAEPVEHTIVPDPTRPRARVLERPLTVAALPAPPPGHPHFPAFLVLAARLGMRGAKARVGVAFEPLEDGRVLLLSTSEGPAAVRALLEAALDLARTAPIAPEVDMALTPVLGDPARQRELEAAFRAASCLHLGIDGKALRRKTESLRASDLERAVQRWLSSNQAGTITVREAAPE